MGPHNLEFGKIWEKINTLPAKPVTLMVNFHNTHMYTGPKESVVFINKGVNKTRHNSLYPISAHFSTHHIYTHTTY